MPCCDVLQRNGPNRITRGQTVQKMAKQTAITAVILIVAGDGRPPHRTGKKASFV